MSGEPLSAPQLTGSCCACAGAPRQVTPNRAPRRSSFFMEGTFLGVAGTLAYHSLINKEKVKFCLPNAQMVLLTMFRRRHWFQRSRPWTKCYTRWRCQFLDPRLAHRVRIEPDCLKIDDKSLIGGCNLDFSYRLRDDAFKDILPFVMDHPIKESVKSEMPLIRAVGYLDRRFG